MNARIAAAQVLIEVFSAGRTLDAALPPVVLLLSDSRDRALTQELCFGVMRWYFRLDAICARLLHRPLRPRDTALRAVLFCGLYQLGWLRVPAHAAVAESVETAKSLRADAAVGLVNAVLRRYQREGGKTERDLEDVSAARYAHPDWFIKAVRKDWPEHWQTILEANNQRPPMHLRVNLLAGTREECLRDLSAAGFKADAAAWVESGIRLKDAADVESIPGFQEGRLSVQDWGAQLAAPLLDARPGNRVLDACAAPGGKAAHILERTPQLAELVAMDHHAQRLEKLRANFARLRVNGTLVAADATHPESWPDRRLFDRILIDAPCSATGVIRRHPDIKLLRRPGQLARYAAIQQTLLRGLVSELCRGGRMLYSTCSVLRRENDRQIEKFLRNHKDVRPLIIDGPWGIATEFGRQTLPGIDDTDGFYYALLEKN
ncbi:MAG: 16S rRNA (cytosine(967)-C(5))-methyltransferase RsmB [Gammaproteobacteria bacterium]|nr:16S rRNA (cytosine(967)-C(5))-methyltransferase RsmB [Gammaproteobacteria bacterium]